MPTLAQDTVVVHATITLETERPLQFVDLTDRLDTLILDAGLGTGVVNIQSPHTTTAVVLNEHEPLLLDDLDALLERLAPAGAAYRHDDLTVRAVNRVPGERRNGHAHCRAALLGAGVCLNVVGGRLQRGRWGRVLFVELDGPRWREVSVMMIGAPGSGNAG
jgi:secondary thiamine-phosphate synthase enzyme